MWRVALDNPLQQPQPLAEALETAPRIAIESRKLNLWYGDFQALFDVDLDVKHGIITSLIGPSGCGKTTFLRTVNRINDRLGYVRTDGTVEVLGKNILDEDVELLQLRKQIGMVFQRPNPLPLSIRDNVLFSYRLHEPAARKMSTSDLDAVARDAPAPCCG